MINVEKKPKKKIMKKDNFVEDCVENEKTQIDDVVKLKENIDINRIFFISDIHIKNNNEIGDHVYYHVFDNLFKELKKQKINKNDLVVILGDMLDTGKYITASASILLQYLYSNLLELSDVISILGNHEFIGVTDGKDLVTSIITSNFKSKYTNYFLLDNKIYLYGNIAFGHTYFTSPVVTDCKKYNDKYVTIGLWHGSINGAKYDNEMTATKSQFSMKDFKDYKYCAFGDLHTQQWMRKDRTAFYPSSLLQHKINEGIDHGMVKLDVKKGKTEFVQINNKYKKLHIFLDNDGNILNCDLSKFNKDDYADLQITYGKHSEKNMSNVKKCFDDVGVKIMNCKEKPNFELIKIDTEIKIGEKIFKIRDMKTREDVNDGLCNFVIANHEINDEDKEQLKEDFGELIYNKVPEDLIKIKNVELLSISATNILIYNSVTLNFEKIQGILGGCQNNSFGKSSLIELLSICLHLKSPRCSNPNSFVRRGMDDGECSVKIKVNDIIYIVRRVIKRKSNFVVITNLKTNEEFTSENRRSKFKKETHLGSKNEVEDFMNKFILSYDEIYEVLIMSQSRENGFLELDDDDKVKKTFKMTNLEYIDTIATACVSELTRLKTKITETLTDYISNKNKKNNDRQQWKENIKHVEQQLEEKKILLQNNNLQKYLLIIEQYEEEKIKKIKYEENLKYYDKFEDIQNNEEELLNSCEEFNNEILQKTNEIKILEKQIKTNKNIIVKNKKKLNVFGDMEKKHVKFEQQKEKNINELNDKIKELSKTLKKCKQILKTEYIATKKQKTIIENDIKNTKKEIDVVNSKLNLFKKSQDVIDQYDLYLKKKSEKDAIVVILKFLDSMKITSAVKKQIDSEKQKFQTKQTLIDSEMLECLEYKSNFDEYFSSNFGTNFVLVKDELWEKQNLLLKELEKCEKIICDYETQQENQIVANKIDELEKSLEECKVKILENYDEYEKLQKENEKLLAENEKLENAIEKIKNKIDQINNKIDKNNQSLQTIKKWNEEYVKYIELKEKYDLFMKNFIVLEKKFENAKKENIKIELQNKKIEDDISFMEKILSGVYKNAKKIKNYEILHESLKNKGFYDMSLENIIVNLQQSLNVMCDYIGHERINISMTKTSGEKQTYKMLISSQKIPDMSNAGGFEKGFVELLFKMAFLKINSKITCNVLMLDEIYDACSEDNKHMAVKLVEFFKLHYKKMLVVSHNPTIMSLFDSTFTIKYDSVNGNILNY